MNSKNYKSLQIIILLCINFIYACVSIFTKLASQQAFMSWGYMLALVVAVGAMGLYAVLWQQVLKRIELSLAYMFKGTSLIFVMLLAYSFFDEHITWNNIVGTMIIIIGIVLYAHNSSPLNYKL